MRYTSFDHCQGAVHHLLPTHVLSGATAKRADTKCPRAATRWRDCSLALHRAPIKCATIYITQNSSRHEKRRWDARQAFFLGTGHQPTGTSTYRRAP
eukprot:scaffold187351_cov30-Tisochrysis_lutea.AAC.1